MYIGVRDGKIISWSAKPYANSIFVDMDFENFEADKYVFEDNKLKDISSTQEYKEKQEEKRKREVLVQLQEKITELDNKRIRALAEPSVKDEQTGETWLDYYNSQVLSVRNEIVKLQEKK